MTYTVFLARCVMIMLRKTIGKGPVTDLTSLNQPSVRETTSFDPVVANPNDLVLSTFFALTPTLAVFLVLGLTSCWTALILRVLSGSLVTY